jgi:ABC-type sulfate/molybdate transport systems ATPase subunit
MSLEFVSQSKLLLPPSGPELLLQGRIEAGEIVGLQGPSGCGKSTLLRHMAQVADHPFAMRLHDSDVPGLAPQDRRISLVFQKALLFPHLSVRENLRFPMRFQSPYSSWSRELQDSRIDQHLAELGLQALSSRSVVALSGGEAMRIALIRAMVSIPKCLLLDEAFAALDKETKALVKTWLKARIKEHRIPTLLVAHVAEDLANFADRSVTWPESGKPLQF